MKPVCVCVFPVSGARDAASSQQTAFVNFTFVFLRTSRPGSACSTCLCVSCSTRTCSSCLPHRRAPARASPSMWVPPPVVCSGPVRMTSVWPSFCTSWHEWHSSRKRSVCVCRSPELQRRPDLQRLHRQPESQRRTRQGPRCVGNRGRLTSSCLLPLLGRHRSALRLHAALFTPHAGSSISSTLSESWSCGADITRED